MTSTNKGASLNSVHNQNGLAAMIYLLALKQVLKLEYFALKHLWRDLAIDWTTLEPWNRLAAKHFSTDCDCQINDLNFDGDWSKYQYVPFIFDEVFVSAEVTNLTTQELADCIKSEKALHSDFDDIFDLLLDELATRLSKADFISFCDSF